MPLPDNTQDYTGVSEGIDRITDILTRQSTNPESLPSNILNALTVGSYNYGHGGTNLTESVQKYMQNQQNAQINQQKALFDTYDAKLKIGDRTTKALDEKIKMFVGSDPMARNVILEELNNDPESIDPNNAYQISTKIAGIVKRNNLQNIDRDLEIAGKQSDIEYKRYLSTRGGIGGNKDGGSAGNDNGRTLPVSAAKITLENRESLDKAKRALALISGQDIITTSGAVFEGDKSATGFKGYTPDVLLQRIDPKGVATRAAIADISSLKVHDRSGAVVTAAEYPRLEPFIPKMNDSPESARTKLKRFISEYQAIVDENENFYRQSGYRVPENVDRFNILSNAEDPRIQQARDEGYSDEEIQQYLGGQ